MRNYNKAVEYILEALDTPPPQPPAYVQTVNDTRLTFDDILNLIKKHEGVKPHIYKDSLGIPTVGIGFKIGRAHV